MSDTKRKLLRGSVVVTAGRVTGYALAFARNVILARILTREDFGLAVMLGTTVLFVEVAARTAFGQQLIQRREDDCDDFQATSHVLQFALGLSGGIVICAVSFPMAHMLGQPQHAWLFLVLAVVPIARGGEHLDYFRQQREYNYVPATLAEVVPQIIVTIAAWPLAVWLRDFRAVLWIMIARAILGAAVTHLTAQRAYRWAWRVEDARGAWMFSWPLLLNSIVMFAGQQGDQLLVGGFVSVTELALYALAVSLVNIPWFICGQAASAMMLPLLCRAQEDAMQFRTQYRRCMECAGVGAAVFMLPMIIAGEHIILALFGGKYRGAGSFVAVLGAASTLRFLRLVPAIAAMARADTMNQLYANLLRSVSIALAAAVAVAGGSVITIAVCPVLAELFATFFSLRRLEERQGVPLRDSVGVIIYVVSLLGVVLTLVFCFAADWNVVATATASIMILCLSIVVGRVAFPILTRPFTEILTSVARRGRKIAMWGIIRKRGATSL